MRMTDEPQKQKEDTMIFVKKQTSVCVRQNSEKFGTGKHKGQKYVFQLCKAKNVCFGFNSTKSFFVSWN